MEETDPPVTMQHLMDGLRGLSDRMNQMEGRLPAAGNPNPPRGTPRRQPQHPQFSDDEDTDDDKPSHEDDGELPPPAPNPRQGRRERPGGRGRGRDREGDYVHQPARDVKLQAPTFVGRVDPEAYLDWERRMEHIFEYYQYSDERKVSLATAQLTDSALTWWDREVSERRRLRRGKINLWDDMRAQLRKRFVPIYYYRDLQKRFRKLSQGTRTVEDYFKEFEKIKNRLEVQDSEETLMAQFLDGLQDRIARKLERQNYVHFDELLHYAIQAEQHIRRKQSSAPRGRSN